ncbi:hypothetical protein GUI51_13410 [Enterococcus mundtii]|uniref:Uncharacterized protein n=1 Tax=Enterococcus mundtii TaxID=53346 RepID=A0ABQ0VGW0_ENTMU|nr:hypothetical protein [Enterococcus mundtii]MZU11514.1 hypothetical protein [Bifidobacterium longum]GEN18599.1 hypothetical protein LAC02_18800 [Ligilactobacillus acidipiscis]AUB54430.1 hypothetical protein EM4838_15545 [Enterococcus mundtii]MZZ60077.1 hypothetical protein [Enterococcus mundtii]MZZ63081.1 hypothetical protein [Enterococcus mundtii]
MKKVLATGVIVLGTLGLFGNKVQADDQTQVEFSVGSEYLLEIPAKVTLSDYSKTYLDIKTKNHNLSPTEYVMITLENGLTDNSEITLSRYMDTDTTIKTTITNNGASINLVDKEISIFDARNPQEYTVATLFIDPLQDNYKSGKYTTTLTFGSEIRDRDVPE